MALCSNKMRYFNVSSLVLIINIFILHTLVFTLMHIPYVDGFCFNKYDRFASLNIIQRQNYMKTRLRKTYSDEENPLSSTTMKIYQSRNNDDSESSENTVFNSETQSLKSERFATYSSQLNKLSEFTASREGRNVEKEVGGYDPSERVGGKTINVGDPQIRLQEKEFSVSSILKELAAIQQQGPQKYCILGTRHCSYLHQQIIELL